MQYPTPGTVTMTYTPTDGSAPMEFEVANFPGGGGIAVEQVEGGDGEIFGEVAR